MKNSKILISENTDLFKSIVGELTKYVYALNQAAEKYDTLELGEVSAEVAELILSPGGEKTIEAHYWDALKQQLDKSGIVNKILRETALNGSKEPIEQYKASHRRVHSLSLTYRDTLRHVIFDGSNFNLVNDYEENILEEYAREYLTDPAEEAFFQAVQKLSSAISEYRTHLKKVEANHYISRSLIQLDSVLKSTEKGDWVADPARAAYFYRAAKRNQNADPLRKVIL